LFVCDIVQRCYFSRVETLEELRRLEAAESVSHGFEINGRKNRARFYQDDCASFVAPLEVVLELFL
jgi:hypothetical protein